MIEIRTTPSFWQNLQRNLIAGLWLITGSRRSLRYISPTPLQLIFWVILGCSANTVFSWLLSEGQGNFNAQGLVSYLLWPFLALIAGIFLSQRIELQRVTLVPTLLWLILDVYFVSLQSILQYLGLKNLLPEFAYAYDILPRIFSVLFIWQSAAVIWVFARELKWPWWERVLILLATLVTLAIWQGVAVKNQPIWQQDEITPSITEEALYAQSDLLQQELSNIHHNTTKDTHWYFLGIAGAGYQDVFRSEVEKIKQQFDDNFATQGYSLALINNSATTETYAMATKTSIERSLNTFAKAMNPEHDVLFIYMTSHGLQNQFELANEPVAMDSIDPKWLRQALDKAGIRWRVIVISACYSGSFIPALRSPNTLIITASAADKSSFGCTNEADYTYFGRAFFDEAMRNQHSLLATFNQAKSLVTEWEQAQGFEPSSPQWVIGDQIEKVLPKLEQALFYPKTSSISMTINSASEQLSEENPKPLPKPLQPPTLLAKP